MSPAEFEDRFSEAVRGVREAVAAEGGAFEIVDFDERNGILEFSIRGACKGCAGENMILTQLVEFRLRRSVPGLRRVIPVSV